METTAEFSVERLRTFLRVGLLALLSLSPLPYGAVQPWATLAMEVWAACLGALALEIFRQEPRSLTSTARMLVVPTAGLVLIGLAQLAPVPAAWAGVVSPHTAETRLAVGEFVPHVATRFAPYSLDGPVTLDAVVRLVAYVLIGLSAAVAVRTMGHLRQLAIVIAILGAFQGLYGSAEYLSGHQHIFAYAKPFFLDAATGTFINRNHFAGYLAMTLPLALALALDRTRTPRGDWRERIVKHTEASGLPKLLGAVATFSIWIGVVLSYSRGGMVIAMAVTLLAVLALAHGTRRLHALALILILPISWLLWQEVRTPADRFVSPREELVSIGGRVPAWRVASQIVAQSPVLGTGLGTFEIAFDSLRTPDVRARWDHAHNDWLESATEAGVLGAAFLIWILYLVMRRRPTRVEGVQGSARFPLCISVSILGIAMYSGVDFCLRIPGNAILLAALVGVATQALPTRLNRLSSAA